MNPLDAVGTGQVADVEVGMFVTSLTRQEASGVRVGGVVVDIRDDESGRAFVVWRQDRKLWFDTILGVDVDAGMLEDPIAFVTQAARVAAAQILAALPRRPKPADAPFIVAAGRLTELGGSGLYLPYAENRYRVASIAASRGREAS